jgi:EAL domain-containing protein (putative c-di-GMP-specific phosphodiesterase class I)
MRNLVAENGQGRGPSPDDQRELRAERDRFVGFAFAGGELLLEIGPDHRIVFAAGAVKSITGAEPAAVIGKAVRSLVADGDRRLLDRALHQAKDKGRTGPHTLTFERGAAGPARITLSGRCLPEKDEALYLVVNRASLMAASVPLDAKHDAETGVLDKQSFAEFAKALVGAEDRPQDLALALVQLQGIQDLRQHAGNDAVDALLGEVGAFLQLNSVDGAAVGRLAADKFGVVTSAGQGALKPGLERLVRVHDPHSKTVQVHERAVKLDTAGLTPADAARALAFTLSQFVSRPEEFSASSLAESFRAQIAETVARMSQLKNVILEKKIEVAFQPIVDLQGRAIHHHEMLARFEPNASPYQLISFAERIGLIEDIDLLICQRGISVLAAQRNDKTSIAINISGRSLASDMFAQSLIGLCAQRPALRERILFEITESAAIEDLARVERILTQLRQSGHGICLDDFGAGASSFPYLQALPVDFVKIDGVYVDRMTTSRKDRAIVVAMVSMCCELEIGTIAEKIEREEQALTLRELGVGYGQGYLFGKPTLSLASAIA